MKDVDKNISRSLQYVEFILYASRLALVPMALGLLLGIGALLYNFLQQALDIVNIQFFKPQQNEEVLIIEVLRLIDYFLLSGLMVMVAINGYDFFVSHIYVRGRKDTPDWVGAMGIHGLKMNLFITICAISSFQLLQIFFDIVADSHLGGEMRSLLPWLFGLHTLFLVTAVVIAVLSRLMAHSPK